MPVPSTISDLSTTPALNSPAGSESPALVDDYLRTHAAFIKQVNDASVKTTGDQTVAGTKTFSSAPVVPGLSDSGNLTFTGTGNRITGDFSNATAANRVMFQTSTVNGNTIVGAIPNGTGNIGQFVAFNSSDSTNSSALALSSLATEARLASGITGTGTFLPMTFYTGGSERMRIGTSGQIGLGGENYGTSGQALVSNGSGAAPSWQTISSGLTAASTAEAQAGTIDTKAITPLKLREGLNASGSAPIYACRAWVNFNGTGTVAIRASGNVSSITDNGTGDYTVNFTTAMPDDSYAFTAAANVNSTTALATLVENATGRSTTGIRVICAAFTGTLTKPDVLTGMVAIFR